MGGSCGTSEFSGQEPLDKIEKYEDPGADLSNDEKH